MRQDRRGRPAARLAIAIAMLLMLLGIAFFAWRQAGPTVTPAPRTGATNTGTTGTGQTPASSKAIRVGVILSHASALETRWVGRPPGYGYTTKTLRMGLADGEFDLYPIIEPGTADQGELPKILEQYFAGRRPIECTDREALQSIDVFLASGITNLTPEMHTALRTAIHDDAKGLLIRAWLGLQAPGPTPDVLALNGFRQGEFHVYPQNRASVVRRDHPILKDIVPVGATLQLEPNGLAGFHNGTTLIEFNSSELDPPITTQPADAATYVHASLYTASYGKGRIVGCCWLGSAGDPATKDRLRGITLRSVRWLAGRLPE